MSITSQIKRAAQAIKKSKAILIGAGAGMGADSGLPTFRGDEGFWNAYPVFRNLNLSFTDLANPDWFDRDPHVAWGFYGHRLNMYRETVPHAGFHLIQTWAKQKPGGAFVFTSNVDGHFSSAGYPNRSIYEIHGSIHHLQCSKVCCNDIWPIGDTAVTVDESTCRAEDPLPRCPHCGAVARPNILMFNDWSWYKDRAAAQARDYRTWINKAQHQQIAIIECGAGTAIPSVRMEMRQQSNYGTLIRINCEEPETPSGHISLPLGALEALTAIDQFI